MQKEKGRIQAHGRTRGQLIRRIGDLLKLAGKEDLELFLLFIERYLTGSR